jgi:hypothetical protein
LTPKVRSKVKWEILKWASCTFNVSGIKKIRERLARLIVQFSLSINWERKLG